MISTKVLILIGLVACFNSQLVDSLSCKNEKGESLDYYVMIKPPKQKSSNPRLNTGGATGAIDNKDKNAGWKLTEKDLNDKDSYIGTTTKEVYANPGSYSYVQYNDAKPEEGTDGKDSSTYAHAKGALMWDDKTAVWIIHSAPKFLPVFHLKKYGYPETARVHGQNFMCITMDAKSVGTVLDHLATIKAQLYAVHINKNAFMSPQIQEDVNTIANKKNKNELPKGAKVDDARIKHLTTSVKSKGGETFTIISKSRKDEVDIWSGIAAPSLKSTLAVKTWTLLQKAAALLQSVCSLKERVINVMDMEVQLGSEKVEWGKNDHSKWGICTDKGKNCYCQGDMNRATSQFKRGGGAVCISSKPVHDTFEKSFSTQYSCSNKLEKNPKK